MEMDGDTTARDDIGARRLAGLHRPRRDGALAVTAGAALVCSAAAAWMLFTLVVIVHPLIAAPLAVAGTALVAALSAAWTSTLMARDGTRADLGAVLRRMVPVALVLLVVVPPLFTILLTFTSMALIAEALTFGALSAVAARAAWAQRSSGGTVWGDVRFTFVVLAVAVAVIKATLWLADIAGLAGA